MIGVIQYVRELRPSIVISASAITLQSPLPGLEQFGPIWITRSCPSESTEYYGRAMADYQGYASGSRNVPPHPGQAGPQPPIAPSPSGYQQGGGDVGAPSGAQGQQGFAQQSYNAQGYSSSSGQPVPPQNDMSAMNSQMSNMGLGMDGHGTARA